MFQGDSKNKSYVVHEFKAGLNAKVIIFNNVIYLYFSELLIFDKKL